MIEEDDWELIKEVSGLMADAINNKNYSPIEVGVVETDIIIGRGTTNFTESFNSLDFRDYLNYNLNNIKKKNSFYLDSLIRKRDSLQKKLNDIIGISSNKDMSIEIDIDKVFRIKRDSAAQFLDDCQFVQISNNIALLDEEINKLLKVKESNNMKSVKWKNYYQKK